MRLVRKSLPALLLWLIAAAALSCGEQPAERSDPLALPEWQATLPSPPPTTTTQTTTKAATTNATAAEKARSEATDLVSRYSLENQFAHLTELASDRYQGRRSGSAGARAAAGYIETQYSQLGLQPWRELGLNSLEEPFNFSGISENNIIGIIPGSDPQGGFLILGAHYDHLGVDAAGQVFNGADDNAAGVATLLETARIIQASGLISRTTLVFCAFSGEEEGEHGAKALGAALTQAGLAQRVEMINVDGIGATGGSYLGVWDEGASNTGTLVAALRQGAAFFGTTIREEGTDIGSDAQPFVWQYGIPAVTVDWHWGQDESLFHPAYHSVDDDPELIDQAVLSQATQAIIAGFWLRATQL